MFTAERVATCRTSESRLDITFDGCLVRSDAPGFTSFGLGGTGCESVVPLLSTVSVIVPCYNYGRFLADCVESVLRQPGVDVEILIIDDSSKDDSADVAAMLCRSESRVSCRRHERNRGHIATYNEGLQWASGTYTVLLSADDMLTPGSLQRATHLLDANPEAGLVYGSVAEFTTAHERPQPRLPVGDLQYLRHRGVAWIESVCQHGTNPIVSPEVVVRTSLQRRLGGYRADLPDIADMDMWLRFAANSDVIELLDTDQAFYRVHSSAMHNRLSAYHDFQQRSAAFGYLFADYGDRFAPAVRLNVDRSMAIAGLRAASISYDGGNVEQIPVRSLQAGAARAYRGDRHKPEYFRSSLGLKIRRLLGARMCHRIAEFRSRLRRQLGST